MKRLFLILCMGTIACVQAAPIESWTLANGARVLLVESHAIPVVDISISFDAGARRDLQNKSGLAAITARMLSHGLVGAEGEPAMTEAQVSDATADTAAEIDNSAGMDRATLRVRTLSNATERDRTITLAARMLAQPAFPDAVLAREKTRTIAAIREADTKPAAIANRAFMKAMYGPHPYAHMPTPESIMAITRSDVRDFHRTHYLSHCATIAIVGDVTRVQAEAIAQALTRRLPMAVADLPAVPELSAAQSSEARIRHPASQSHILIGMPTVRRGDPDHFALTVGNYILGGGGFVSRLTSEVREQRGLSYSVGSSFSPKLQQGPFRISLQTQKSQTEEALKVTRDTLAHFLSDGPTDDEMKAAKDYLLGSFALSLDSNKKMLDIVANIGFYGLPLDYLDTWKSNISRVTARDVREAFRRKLSMERMTTVIVAAPE